jgi:hypothetical protein
LALKKENDDYFRVLKKHLQTLIEKDQTLKGKGLNKACGIINELKTEGSFLRNEVKKELKLRIQAKEFSSLIDLSETVKDAREFQEFLITKLGVLPENSIIMAAEEDQEKIYQHVDVDLGQEMNIP